MMAHRWQSLLNYADTQVAVTLINGHKVTTSFNRGSDSDQPDNLDLSRSFSETSLKKLPLQNSSSMPPTPTFPTPQSRPLVSNASRLMPLSPDCGSPRVPLINFESTSGSPRLPLGKPPALPPKTPTSEVQKPPPRPKSKELRLDDILRCGSKSDMISPVHTSQTHLKPSRARWIMYTNLL